MGKDYYTQRIAIDKEFDRKKRTLEDDYTARVIAFNTTHYNQMLKQSKKEASK